METLTEIIRQYGLIAVFLGCMAEGESIAIVAGFFAHQAVLPLGGTFALAAVGAFLGDTVLFLLGRRFSTWERVRKLTARPGFNHALALAARRPRAFVFCNRYVYGMRIVGGVAAGLADIPWRLFVLWNAMSSLVWAALFLGIGWFFGLGAEAVIGRALHDHQRLLAGLAIAAVFLLAGALIARHVKRREASSRYADPAGRDGNSTG